MSKTPCTPASQVKKRDLSSPEDEYLTKKYKHYLSPSTVIDIPFDAMENATSTNLVLDQSTITSIASALQPSIQLSVQSNIESLLNKTVQSIVDGVLHGLQQRISTLEAENSSLQERNFELEKKVTDLEDAIDKANQYSRRNSLRVSGIKESTGESFDNIVLDLCDAVVAGVKLEEVDRCHRVGKAKKNKSRDILVKFTSYRARQKLYTMRTKLKDEGLGYQGVFVNEDLTRPRSELLFEARTLVKSKKLAGAWSADGNILIKIETPGKRAGDEPTFIIKRISSVGDLTPYAEAD
jgi:hypothetical protein